MTHPGPAEVNELPDDVDRALGEFEFAAQAYGESRYRSDKGTQDGLREDLNEARAAFIAAIRTLAQPAAAGELPEGVIREVLGWIDSVDDQHSRNVARVKIRQLLTHPLPASAGDAERINVLEAALKRALPTVEHYYHTNPDPNGFLWADVKSLRAALGEKE